MVRSKRVARELPDWGEKLGIGKIGWLGVCEIGVERERLRRVRRVRRVRMMGDVFMVQGVVGDNGRDVGWMDSDGIWRRVL